MNNLGWQTKQEMLAYLKKSHSLLSGLDEKYKQAEIKLVEKAELPDLEGSLSYTTRWSSKTIGEPGYELIRHETFYNETLDCLDTRNEVVLFEFKNGEVLKTQPDSK